MSSRFWAHSRYDSWVKILILMPLRYPTEKAYGTNVAYTAEAFRELGHEVYIFTAGVDTCDQRNNKVTGITSHFIRIANKLRSLENVSLFSKFGFYLLQVSFTLKMAQKIRTFADNTLILTRFPLVSIGICLLLNRKKILLELHQVPNQLELKLLKFTKKYIVIYVTNVFLSQDLVLRGYNGRIWVIPNAAPESFHQIKPKLSGSGKKITIGYAGKALSSGHDNGLDIILRLLKSNPEVAEIAKWLLIGCEEFFQEKVEEMLSCGIIPKDSVQVIDHIDHSKLLRYVSEFDAALIPYPENKYYSISFPIKIIEMAAAGIPIIVSNTQSHRRILGEEGMKFSYEPESESSLKSTIECVWSNTRLLVEESERLKLFSRDNTYSNKVKKIIELQ